MDFYYNWRPQPNQNYVYDYNNISRGSYYSKHIDVPYAQPDNRMPNGYQPTYQNNDNYMSWNNYLAQLRSPLATQLQYTNPQITRYTPPAYHVKQSPANNQPSFQLPSLPSAQVQTPTTASLSPKLKRSQNANQWNSGNSQNQVDYIYYDHYYDPYSNGQGNKMNQYQDGIYYSHAGYNKNGKLSFFSF